MIFYLRKLNLLFFLLIFSFIDIHAIDIVEIKLNKIVNNFINDYKVKRDDKQTTVAVLPFYCSDELLKRGFDKAVSNLIISKLKKHQNFTFVERMEIEKVLKELKLQYSGLVPPEDLINLGKFYGAKYQIIGSIEKIGKFYYINARFVETETAEIISSAYEALPVDIFEDKAKDYLIPLPKTEVLGFYLKYLIRKVDSIRSPYTLEYNGVTKIITPNDVDIKELGFGIRYNFINDYFIDISASFSGRIREYVASEETYGFGFSSVWYIRPKTSNYELSINKYFSINRFNFYYGLGFCRNQSILIGDGKYTSPFANIRFEFKPKDRISLSLLINFEFKKRYWKIYDIKSHKLSQFYIEPSLGFYF